MRELVIVGGGAAGLMAALYAAREGAKVQLLERNEKLGKKIYITGKGRCNLTNTAEPQQFMGNIPRNPRFLYSALNLLDNRGTMELFTRLGLLLKEERGGRVFPASDRASDVTRTLERACKGSGVKVHLNTRVERLLLEGGGVRGMVTGDGRELPADAVIVATGGLSYPSTGSTGDGYRLAEQAGLGVTPTRPSLVGIDTLESWPGALSGLTLKNVRLTAARGKKLLYNEQGELLLTHYGISGPLVLSLSALLPDDCEGQALQLDLKPALDEKTLGERLLRELAALGRKQLASAMDRLMPHSLGLALLELAGLSPTLPAHGVTRECRRELVRRIKGVTLTVRGLRGYEEAVVTRGGVDVRGINPSTMGSKAVAGLYFAGEVLDVDALTGGFNLQIAFSTGALAGKSAAQYVTRNHGGG
ncbi:MAG: NAD(P)/FAD-dependent oxidoreductase [Candidatus Excrementavichristensenella sp.]|jgi:predicted Rossmann fold flavoprotein